MKSLFRAAIRAIYRALLPKQAKNTLALWLMLDRQDHAPEPITAFDDRPVVVLAPHMDDEVIGCGGTLLRHIAAGARVCVVYLTDGRRGNPDLYESRASPDEVRAAELALVEQRKAESREAAQVLGIHELVFLDAPDTQLQATDQIAARVREVIDQHRAAYVYLPSPLDTHDDHWATNLVLDRALRNSTERCQAIFRGYEVWSPLWANRVVDITEQIDAKSRALACFVSQTRRVDYARATEGLNAYRSIHVDKGQGHAEAFLEMTPSQFTELIERQRHKA